MDFENTMHYESTLSKWVENDKFIEEMNGKNLTYTLGHNHFSGMDSVDFSKDIGLSSLVKSNIIPGILSAGPLTLIEGWLLS
jgi:hypothetical protein